MGYVMGKTIANRRIIKQEKIIDFDKNKTTYKTNFSFNRYNNINIAGVILNF
jgi:hypothetical protein